MKWWTPAAWWRCALYLLITVAGMTTAAYFSTHMPGASFQAAPAPLTIADTALRAQLVRHVAMLAGTIGERNAGKLRMLEAAATYISNTLQRSGYAVQRQNFTYAGMALGNLAAALPGTTHPAEIIVVGAHYDTVSGTPGADDNASGVAALLALADRCATQRYARTLRFVAFVNEEPPFFQTEDMGSLVYAKSCAAQREKIQAMLCLEMLGYYSAAPASQRFPEGTGWLLQRVLPTTGDFIGFTANVRSLRLLRRSVSVFRTHAQIPSEGAVLPEFLSGMSDNWSFWQAGYPAVMITDTAMFRNPHYHEAGDTPATLNYDAMTHVTRGVAALITDLAGKYDRALDAQHPQTAHGTP
jgi:Zn-dependent M28 family amino/carboxypeptidase